MATAIGSHGREAVVYAVEAGREAMDVLAYEAAVRAYRVALDGLSLAPGAADGVDLELALADALTASGDTTAGEAAYRRAADLAGRSGRIADQARAVLGLTGGVGMEVTIADPDHIRVIEKALETIGDDEIALRSWLSAPAVGLVVVLDPALAAPRARRGCDRAGPIGR